MILLNGGSVFLSLWQKRSPTHGPAPTRVGGFIWPEFCRWRLDATCRARLPFASPCSYPKPECLITSAAWPWRALHLDNFDTLFAKATGKILCSTVIRDQALYSVEG